MQSKKKPLGKGLSALLPQKPVATSDATEHIIAAATAPRDSSEADRVHHLRVADIRPNPHQPRQHFDEGALDELAASIRTHGLLQPVLVTRKNNAWVLVAGERRWRAAQKAGLEVIPALVVNPTEREELEYALVENLQREDLNPIEEARAYAVLMERFGLSQEEVAERVEKSRPAVANALRLLKLPTDIQQSVENGTLSAGHARALLALPSEEEQRLFRDLVIERQLSVRELEQLIHKHLQRKPRRKETRSPRTSHQYSLDDLRTRFEEVLACRVQITMTNPDRGKVEIYFSSLDELERIKEALGVSNF